MSDPFFAPKARFLQGPFFARFLTFFSCKKGSPTVSIFLKTFFRPAYQDELDDLQIELKSLYDEYATKYRNVVYLEQLLEGEKKNLPQAEEILVNLNSEDRNGLNLDDPGLEVLLYILIINNCYS